MKVEEREDRDMENQLPRDPYMLMSVINTQLRDRFSNLEKCCDYYGVGCEEIKETLSAVDYRYDEELNQFV